jgi:hypothetical protein
MPIQKITSGIIDGTTTFANTQISGTITASQIATVNANTITSGSIPLAQIPQLTGVKLPTGSVLQVLQTVKTDTFSVTGQTFTDITGLSVSITPTSSTSKILVMFTTAISNNNGAYSGGVRLVRNSTPIYVGDAAGNRIQSSNWAFQYYYWEVGNLTNTFLDSPATTSATTYKLQLVSGYAGQTVYIGRSYLDSDDLGQSRYPSSITVMEIAA